MSVGSSMVENDFLKAVRALEAANVKEPYYAVVDPSWTEEDVVRMLCGMGLKKRFY